MHDPGMSRTLKTAGVMTRAVGKGAPSVARLRATSPVVGGAARSADQAKSRTGFGES